MSLVRLNSGIKYNIAFNNFHNTTDDLLFGVSFSLLWFKIVWSTMQALSSGQNEINFEPVVEIDLENYYYEKYQIKAHCCNIENDHWEECVVG